MATERTASVVPVPRRPPCSTAWCRAPDWPAIEAALVGSARPATVRLGLNRDPSKHPLVSSLRLGRLFPVRFMVAAEGAPLGSETGVDSRLMTPRSCLVSLRKDGRFAFASGLSSPRNGMGILTSAVTTLLADALVPAVVNRVIERATSSSRREQLARGPCAITAQILAHVAGQSGSVNGSTGAAVLLSPPLNDLLGPHCADASTGASSLDRSAEMLARPVRVFPWPNTRRALVLGVPLLVALVPVISFRCSARHAIAELHFDVDAPTVVELAATGRRPRPAGFVSVLPAPAVGRRRQRQVQNTDVHLHVPAGTVPKDGPSAGVAMTAVNPRVDKLSPSRPGGTIAYTKLTSPAAVHDAEGVSAPPVNGRG